MAVPSNIHIPDEERIYYGFKAIKQEYFKQINIKIDKKIFFECLFLDIVGLIRNHALQTKYQCFVDITKDK